MHHYLRRSFAQPAIGNRRWREREKERGRRRGVFGVLKSDDPTTTTTTTTTISLREGFHMHNLPPAEQKRAKHRSKHSKHKSNSKLLDIDHAPPRDRSCSESGTVRPAGVFLAGIQEGAEPLGRGLVVVVVCAVRRRQTREARCWRSAFGRRLLIMSSTARWRRLGCFREAQQPVGQVPVPAQGLQAMEGLWLVCRNRRTANCSWAWPPKIAKLAGKEPAIWTTSSPGCLNPASVQRTRLPLLMIISPSRPVSELHGRI